MQILTLINSKRKWQLPVETFTGFYSLNYELQRICSPPGRRCT